MKNRIVEITSDSAHLSLARGFLVVSRDGEKVGQIAIDDMAGLIIRGHGASLSANICARLAESNVPIVICGQNQSPSSIVWPIAGQFRQGQIMQAQAEAHKPVLKRLWAQLIKAKIMAQAEILAAWSLPARDLKAMAGRVQSGDQGNLEAQAAQRYWPRLMGEDFTRDRDMDGVNAALNYGYTVLRSATARSILAAGLHPSLSINHQSRGDALRLADDLMEPFRPFVDHVVRQQCTPHETLDLTPGRKAALAATLTLDFETEAGASPLQICLDRLAQSLAGVFEKQRPALDLPRPPSLLALQAA